MEGLEALEVVIVGHKTKANGVVIPEQPPWGIRDTPTKGDQVFIPKTLLTSASPQQLLSQTRARKKANISVTWPGVASAESIQPQSSPAAGANFTYTNNTGVSQTLLSAQATFVTDATVANRFLTIQFTDSLARVLYHDTDGTAIPASTSVNLAAYIGAAQVNSSSGNVVLPLPSGLTIPPGGSFNINASGIDAGDQFSAINLTFAGTSTIGAGSMVIFGKSEADLQNIVTEAADNSVIGGTFLVAPNSAFRVYGTTELWCVCLGPNFPYVSALQEVEKTG